MGQTTTAFVKNQDAEMFGLGGKELRAAAAGRGRQAERAQAEIDRRAANRAAKRAGRP